MPLARQQQLLKEGETLGTGSHLVGQLRLRLRRRQQVAAAFVVGRAGWRQESFAPDLLRSRRADRQRLWHWLVVNIPVGTTSLALGAGNPCRKPVAGRRAADPHRLRHPGLRRSLPARGPWSPHRYVFTLFAVNTDKLPVQADTSAAIVGFNLHFTTIEKAILTGHFIAERGHPLTHPLAGIKVLRDRPKPMPARSPA